MIKIKLKISRRNILGNIIRSLGEIINRSINFRIFKFLKMSDQTIL